MSGDTTNNYGNVVNVNGGQGNVGINYGSVGGAPDDGLRAAVDELARLLQGLRPHLTPEQAQTVDEALPELTPDRAALRERMGVLTAVGQIAAAVGTVGQPAVDAVGQLMTLVG
ncbi:hypothetical protein [Streptomyces sp. NPDC056480]|uniref:hypothetical protein n=1 Tax=Streptomyces sp. NPDC056480 TaxID=3345833 RepID=UPI003697BA6F